MYHSWSLCTLYLLACHVRVTVGDSGLSFWTRDVFRALINSLCWCKTMCWFSLFGWWLSASLSRFLKKYNLEDLIYIYISWKFGTFYANLLFFFDFFLYQFYIYIFFTSFVYHLSARLPEKERVVPEEFLRHTLYCLIKINGLFNILYVFSVSAFYICVLCPLF